MKKLIVVLVVCLGVSVISCKGKEHKHSEDTHMHDEAGEHAHDTKQEVKEIASNTLYQCAMDCEKGKSYTKEGTCPVCKKDLEGKEIDIDAIKKEMEEKAPLR